jgi:hypothetical protein
MIRKTIFAALLASSASMGAAQAPPAQIRTVTVEGAAAPAPTTVAAPDPARLAAARQFVDAVLPSGTIEQAMVEGFRAAAREELADPEHRRRDPHLAERIRLSEPVVIEEARRILTELDPSARAVLADFYARHMSVAELEEGSRFFAGPVGRRFYEGVFKLAVSDDYNRAMQALAPDAITAVAGIEQRFAAVAAEMPPIPGMPAPPAAAPGVRPPEVAPPPGTRPAKPAASPAPPAAAAAPPAPPADPARLAAARRMLDAMWPSDLTSRPLNLLPTIETLIAIRFGDLGIPIPPSAGISPNATAAEMAAAFDPHFRARLPILTRFAGTELARLITGIEPGWKRLSAPFYAREFTTAELEGITRFFASPAGRSFAEQSYRAYEDPALVRGLVMLVPRIALQLPAAAQRVEQATAHLPKPAPPAPPAGADWDDDDEDGGED